MNPVRRATADDLPRLRLILSAAYTPCLDVLGADPSPLSQDLAADSSRIMLENVP